MFLTSFLTSETYLTSPCLSFLTYTVGMTIITLSLKLIVQVSEIIPVKYIEQSLAFSNLLINVGGDDFDVSNCVYP